MLKRFYTAVVHRRRAVLAAFVLAAVLSVFASRAVQVDYDINDYLPPDSPSTLALEQMNSAFTGGIPNMRVMVRDVTVPEALDYKEKLAAIDGVEAVTWLDDSLDVTVPLQMQDTATVETYYKDNCALFTVTVEDANRLEAVAAIQDLIGEDNALAGTAVSTAVATNSTVTEVAKIAAIAVVYVLFILILTTDSWVEPLLVLAGLGAAILINNGTNLMFGTISFVTNAAGSILQLAVSLDYSVFLIHRFAECRAARPDASAEDCMVEALCKSTGSILSSGLTTVIGFLALVLMQFQIGPDLGLALAKGVVLSLVTVFTFMPALTLVCYPWMDKTHHKPLLPGFDKFGRFVSRIMLPAALALAVIMVPSYLASNNNEYYYGAAHMFGTNTRLGADTAAIEETFGKSDTWVVLVPEGDTATQAELSDALHAIPEVTGILSYVDNAGASIPPEFVPPDTLKLLVSGGYTRMVLTVNADTEGDAAFALVEKVRATVQQYYPDAYDLAGQGVSTYDLMDTITAAEHRDGHLDQSGHPVFPGPPCVLHCLPHHQHHPAGCDGRLRHPVLGPVSGVPRDAGQKAGHCRHRVHRDHLGDHHGQCAGGGGLPDGGHLHQPAAGPAGQLPGCGRSGVAGHRAAGSAGLSVSGRPAHHQTEKTAEGGLTR